MQHAASFGQSPPLAAPLRFFLTAPLFAMAAAIVLLWHGPQALASRWSPTTLALTHLMTLGFLCLSMIGALLQILPVVAGVTVPKPMLTARWVHLLLVAGAAVLSTAFLGTTPLLFILAMALLAAGFGWLLGACWLGLWRARSPGPTPHAIRLALIALLVTIALGLTLAGAFGGAFSLPTGLSLVALTDLHATLGLGGWVGLLVIGVAFQVVPMFQVTPDYPNRARRWLATALFLLLGAWAIGKSALDLSMIGPAASAGAGAWVPEVLALLAAAGYVVFGLLTLNLLWRRKRPGPDPTTLFWYVGTTSLIACALLWVVGRWWPGMADSPAYPLGLGILSIVGFAYSIINGMLYKIVPFLVWYHLQTGFAPLAATARKAKGARQSVPNVRQVIAETATRGQFVSHLVALLLLLAATLWPAQLARLAAAAFLLSSCWLWINLMGAARLYRGVSSRFLTLADARPEEPVGVISGSRPVSRDWGW